MLQVLLDSVLLGITDALTGGNVPLPIVLLLGLILVGTIAFGLFALVMSVRLNESRQRSSQTNVNVMPSQTALYVVLGVLALVVFLIR
jgi:hypothetical protein